MCIRDRHRIKRLENNDSLHVTVTSDVWVDDSTQFAYFLPSEVFHERAPLGDARTVSFQQAGIDRTEILRGPNPDYAEIIGRLQSVSSNEEEGLGPRKIKSIEHAAGVALEDVLLRNGIVGYDPNTKRLINLVRKEDLRRVETGSDEYNAIISQVRVNDDGEEIVLRGNNGKLGHKFVCAFCGGEEYTFEAGCNRPKCKGCGEVEGGGCG